jgi:hypothetical protein
MCRHPITILIAVCILCPGPPRAAADSLAADELRLQQAGLAADGPGLLAYFRQQTTGANPQQIQDLIGQLGDPSFRARERASERLVALRARALPYLRRAAGASDAEVRRRAGECLRRIEEDIDPALVAAAARVLAARKPDGAADALLDYLPLAPSESTADALRSALAAVALRGGKAEPAVVRALADPEPARRAAAAAALGRAGGQEHHPAVKRLLRDPEALVRLHAALALAERKDADAVPVLIALLGEPSRAQLGPVEDVLYRLAREDAPAVGPGDTAESRRHFRLVWEDWWGTHAGKIDLARLDPDPYLDRTLVVLLDKGCILELDSEDKPIWQIEKVGFPLDVQLLPGERVLVAEHGANRVTERHRSGAVLWEKNVPEPIVAQRLPNGLTFIATKTQLLEVDREGREVSAYSRPDGDQFMRAARLENGDRAFVTLSGQRFVRVDALGRELHSFPVAVQTSGGRIDVQPDGRVLVPQMGQHRVTEYDARGRAVREFPAEQPIAAVRLANGNTLVTCMGQHRAVEFDAAGKLVWQWQYRPGERVTRALRR